MKWQRRTQHLLGEPAGVDTSWNQDVEQIAKERG